MRGRRIPREQADLVRFANMALAEVGQPPEIKPDPNRTNGLEWWPDLVNDRLAHRAAMLATLKMFGPDEVVRCEPHTGKHWSCAGVTVAEALLGVVCHRFGAAS